MSVVLNDEPRVVGVYKPSRDHRKDEFFGDGKRNNKYLRKHDELSFGKRNRVNRKPKTQKLWSEEPFR